MGRPKRVCAAAAIAHERAGAAKHGQGLLLQSFCIPAIHGGQMCESGIPWVSLRPDAFIQNTINDFADAFR
jgi:hypothetical protein